MKGAADDAGGGVQEIEVLNLGREVLGSIDGNRSTHREADQSKRGEVKLMNKVDDIIGKVFKGESSVGVDGSGEVESDQVVVGLKGAHEGEKHSRGVDVAVEKKDMGVLG